jgi:hypothetical protein
MPKQIIILETNPADGGEVSVNVAFWFPVPAGQEVPLSGFVSAFKATATKPGPTAQETTDLQDGKVVEEVHTKRYPRSFTPAQIRGALVAAYTDRKTYRDAQPNIGQFYGTFYDGTAWA